MDDDRVRRIAEIQKLKASLDALDPPVSRETIDGLTGWLDAKLVELVNQDRGRLG